MNRGETSVNTYSVQCSDSTGRTKLVVPPVPPPISRIRNALFLGERRSDLGDCLLCEQVVEAGSRNPIEGFPPLAERSLREDQVQRVRLVRSTAEVFSRRAAGASNSD